ncbi:MAG: enoyl-CoA hydratase-related protein [Nitrospinota bacterium]
MSSLAVEVRDHVAYITLNRPDALNALNWEMVETLIDLLRRLPGEDGVWAAVLRSACERAFCVGADLKERKALPMEKVKTLRSMLEEAHDLVCFFPKPIIAAVNGYALGGGLEFALGCDFLIASEDAVFGLPEVSLGIIPGGGGTQLLPRLIGRAKAKELIFTAGRIDAAEAERLGLVARVVPKERLEEEVEKTVRAIVANAPISLRQAKRAVDRGIEVDLMSGLRLEREAYNVTLSTKDRNEGLRAFAEKRRPRFEGK